MSGHDLPGWIGEWVDSTQRLAAALTARGERMATAESCTGGMIAAVLTAFPGSSAWFECGFVTYSNDAKVGTLGVAPATLAREGAVSEAVAAEMVQGALARSAAALAVAVTGIAGPGGGSEAKPVGMVCFGYAHRDGQLITTTHRLEGGRDGIRRASVGLALAGLLDLIGR